MVPLISILLMVMPLLERLRCLFSSGTMRSCVLRITTQSGGLKEHHLIIRELQQIWLSTWGPPLVLIISSATVSHLWHSGLV